MQWIVTKECFKSLKSVVNVVDNGFNVTEKEDYADISLFEFAFVCSTARNGRHALFVFLHFVSNTLA